MTSDLETGFHQALHEHPQDQATWLAFADWLEETNQPDRAELTRLWWSCRTMPRGRPRSRVEKCIRALMNRGTAPVVPRLTVSHGLQLALVPPGRFQMGSPARERGRASEELMHWVTITRPFYLGIVPVTQAQYTSVMGTNPAFHVASEVGKEDTSEFPVEMVSWETAVAFCQRLTNLRKEKLARRKYRLPTEAEWEYACREAGACTTAYHFGSKILAKQVNHDANGSIDGPAYLGRPVPVGQYPANALGLHDMHGNVWEWCQDWYDEGYYQISSEEDPPGPKEGDGKILRGGCWVSDPHYCRCARRYQSREGYRTNRCFGFRVAMTVGK